MDGYGKLILVVDEEAGCRALVVAQLGHEGMLCKRPAMV